MRKMPFVRFAAAAAMLGSVGFAVAIPGSVAGAAKTPVTATCTNLLGNSTGQLISGCTTSTKAKISAYGAAIPNSSDTGATIYWTDKTTTVETFTYSSVTNHCSTYLGVAASLEEQETATVTGGNSKLTLGAQPPADVCVYLGSDSTILIVGGAETL